MSVRIDGSIYQAAELPSTPHKPREAYLTE
jgi:hypothetical protein